MKKIYLLLSAMTVAASVNAQTLPNAGYESWRVGSAGDGVHNKPVFAPSLWYTADSLIIGLGQTIGALAYGINPSVWQQQVFKDSGANAHGGSYAARLVTADQDTLGLVPGTLSTAEAHVDLTNFTLYFTGGTATTQRPTSVSAWIKYAPTDPTDSANILVQAYGNIGGNADSLIGVGYKKIGATAAYTQYTANVVYAVPGLVVNNFRTTFSSSSDTAAVGSTMWVDDVTMTSVAQIGVGVNNVAASGISVYPNPANEVLFVDGGQGNMLCELMSVSGQVVATKAFSGKGSMDISALPSGIYFYSISENGNVSKKGKVTVSK